MTDTVDLLAGVPLLSSLDRKHLQQLAKSFRSRTFPAGSVVVREGAHHGIGFFVVAEGNGVVTVAGKQVGELGPGSYFGEVALLTDGVRTATVTATTELHCLVMTVWAFRAFVHTDAEVSWKLLEHLGALLHGKG